MEIVKAAPGQLQQLLELYAKARAFMAAHGNPNQWQNGYPDRELLVRDLQAGRQYLCMEGDEIAATFYYALEADPTYAEIEDGAWVKDGPYGVMHRICVASHGRGVGQFCLDWCFRQHGNLRADTHRDNLPMQALLRKCGFVYCGVIHVEDGSSRMAYQKI